MIALRNAEKIELEKQTFYLLPEKAIFWQEQKTLLIADLHLGKAAHFRKAGIAVPDKLMKDSLKKLDLLIDFLELDSIIFLGDLFHSEWNTAWNDFISWLEKHNLRFILVKGNHDILNTKEYIAAGMILKEEPYRLGPFDLTHHPLEKPSGAYNLCGHLHPGIRLKGKARQSITLPCFYFSENRGVLPAFSNFSGKHLLKIKSSDRIYGVTEDRIIPFS